MPFNLTTKHLGRYRQIVEVMISHGFGALMAQLGLASRLELSRRLFNQEPSPDASEYTPAQHVRLALEELGATFIKLGQILSTRPDLLPPAYITELSRLQDEVPPGPWEKVKERIEAELGQPLDKVFANVEPEPIAAASLAQVHAATLLNGDEVVVKAQRPGIENLIKLDLDILYDLARLAQERTPLGEQYELVELVEEFSVYLRAELEYHREARNSERFQANFANQPNMYVPNAYWDYTTRRVLVQERIRGRKINNIEALDAAGYDRHKIALHSANFIVQEVLEDGFFHADPHPGNILIMPGEVIGLVDFGIMGRLEHKDRINLIRLYIVAVQMDTRGIVEQLIRMGVAEQTPDRNALRRDMRRFLLKYHGLPLQEIRAADVLEEIRPILYRHHLRLPSDYWLLAKTLVMMEGVGLKLDPDFDIFAVSRPYVQRFMRRMWLPTTWGPSVLRNLTAWSDMLTNLPYPVNRLLDQAEEGEVGIRFEVVHLDKTINRLDDIANRIIMGVLLSAFILALAMLIPTLNLTWPWNLLTWVVIVSFALMSILGLWLIWSIMRSGK